MSTLKESLKSFEKKQITVSLLGLAAFLGASVIFNYLQMNSHAEQTSKLIARTIQTEDFREVGATLQIARLGYFNKIQFRSQDSRKSFTLPAKAELSDTKTFWHSLAYDQIVIDASDLAISTPGDQIIFEFNRFSLVPYALLIWFLLNVVSFPQTRFMKKKIEKQYYADLAVQKDLAHVEIARKVRHNIRTPLSALLRLSGTTSNIDSEQRALFEGIITQIRSLISELDPHQLDSKEVGSSESLWNSLRHAISENRLVVPADISLHGHIDESIASVQTRFDSTELRSIIANLVNNSIEAMCGPGTIRICARDIGASVVVEVVDDGSGIPQHCIAKVTEKGFSYGKVGGTGLGLFHAKSFIESWGGTLKVLSTPGGTSVTIALLVLDRETWHVPRIKLSKNDNVVVVDDQVSIHRLWNIRLKELGFTGKLLTFFKFSEASAYIASKGVEDQTHFFIDYDLQDQPSGNGLNLLSRLSAAPSKYLVTGSFDDGHVQSECVRLNVGLISKSELAAIPIVMG